MGSEANLCSPYYISRPSLKNVSRVFNETEAVTQQRERKEERGDLFAEMFAQREERAAGGRGPNSATFPHHPVPLSCPWSPPDHLSSPLKSIGGGREHGLLSPGLGVEGCLAFPSNLWRGGRTRQQWGYWLLLHVREPAAAEPRWESGIINRSYRGLGKNAGLCGV